VNTVYRLFGALITASLAGCGLVQSKEEDCLQSSRLTFKDPESGAVVKNLGNRGQTNESGQVFFWLRYKAKNSYGAFVSANMACHIVDGQWKRDTFREVFAKEFIERRLYVKYLDNAIASTTARSAELENCKTLECRQAVRNKPEYAEILVPTDDSRLATWRVNAGERALQLVEESLDNLPIAP
jgi:hypothetical protein